MKKYNVTVDSLGTINWFNLEGKLDREDGPAVEVLKGYKAWYKDGYFYRDNDLPVIEDGYGGKQWRNADSKLHRLTGPALISGGLEEYWIDGIHYSKDDFYLKVAEIEFKKNIIKNKRDSYKKNSENQWSAEDYEISARAHELVDDRMRKMVNDYGQEYYTEIVSKLQELESSVHNLLEGMRKEFEVESYMEKDISKWSSPDLDRLIEILGLAVKAKIEFDCFANKCDDLTPEE